MGIDLQFIAVGVTSAVVVEGFSVVRTGTDTYEIRDGRRILASVVRSWVEAPEGMVRRFRAGGSDFPTLRAAVEEFAKAGCPEG